MASFLGIPCAHRRWLAILAVVGMIAGMGVSAQEISTEKLGFSRDFGAAMGTEGPEGLDAGELNFLVHSCCVAGFHVLIILKLMQLKHNK